MRIYTELLIFLFLLFLKLEFGSGYGFGAGINGTSRSDFRDYIQELTLYDTVDETGNYLYFRSNVPDASKYQKYLKQVKRVCFRGRWDAYASPNYENKADIFDRWARTCFNQTFEYKSFRHLAAGNTTRSSISLYTGTNWAGREYFVKGEIDDAQNQNQNQIESQDGNGGLAQLSGIQEPIQSFALTGHLDDSWELFEGTHFNGSSACAKKSQRVFITGFNEHHLRLLNLTTVGSVRRNCGLNTSSSTTLAPTSPLP